jgi:phosphatidylinositol glycan class B
MSLKPSPSNTPSGTTLFLLALVFRLVNACITRTFFQPDEYYQALEPAHRLIFGTGYATWEWRSIASSRLSSLATDGGVIALLRNLMTLNSNGFEDLLSEIGEGRGGIRSPLGFLIPLIGYWVVKVTGLESTRAIVRLINS